MKDQLLKGRVALITGAADPKGIGAATARLFAEEGAHVIVSDIRPDADEVVININRLSYSAEYAMLDVTDEAQAKKVVAKIVKDQGHLDILICNHGFTDDQLFMKMKLEAFRKVLDVNLTGTFNIIQVARKALRKSEFVGRINITSSIASLGHIGQANYASAKAGLIGLLYTLALELSPKIITNGVMPGAINTSMLASVPEKMLQQFRDDNPLKTIGEPEDVAAVHLFLCIANYINGVIIPVDGGATVGF